MEAGKREEHREREKGNQREKCRAQGRKKQVGRGWLSFAVGRKGILIMLM